MNDLVVFCFFFFQEMDEGDEEFKWRRWFSF